MVAVYADGADLKAMAALEPRVSGWTTNPSLMRAAGVTDYRDFARRVLAISGGKPVSFEVLADDPAGMLRQALEISSWGENVYVKVPVVNTRGDPTAGIVAALAARGVKVNVTAVLTKGQVREAVEALGDGTGIVSVFAGRIADAGRDPVRTMNSARARIKSAKVKLLWASPREVLNVLQATEAGCDIITLPPTMIDKLQGIGRDLAQYSIETVQQFHRDAEGITL